MYINEYKQLLQSALLDDENQKKVYEAKAPKMI